MKLFVIYVASDILVTLAATFVSYSNRGREVEHSETGNSYRIEIITINGVDHEFIIKEHSQYFNGFTHSLECPCLKKKGE